MRRCLAKAPPEDSPHSAGQIPPIAGRTTGQWLKRTVFAPEYQALTESSDVRVTIFCPGLSRNADFGYFNNNIIFVA